jgi:hypothetical protein
MEAWQLNQEQRNARFMAASGAVEGPIKSGRRGLMTGQRVGDFLSGFGLGLFVGAVACLILLGQLAQWGGK